MYTNVDLSDISRWTWHKWGPWRNYRVGHTQTGTLVTLRSEQYKNVDFGHVTGAFQDF